MSYTLDPNLGFVKSNYAIDSSDQYKKSLRGTSLGLTSTQLAPSTKQNQPYVPNPVIDKKNLRSSDTVTSVISSGGAVVYDPFTNNCGPGYSDGKVQPSQSDFITTPVNDLDSACMEHDKDYALAMNSKGIDRNQSRNSADSRFYNRLSNLKGMSVLDPRPFIYKNLVYWGNKISRGNTKDINPIDSFKDNEFGSFDHAPMYVYNNGFYVGNRKLDNPDIDTQAYITSVHLNYRNKNKRRKLKKKRNRVYIKN